MTPIRFVLPLAVALLLGACAPMPQRAGIPTHWHASPNFDTRRADFIIIHHSGSGSTGRALRTLTDAQREVSAHYLIGRDGTIFQLVDERARAWHAGESRWGMLTDLNSASIGIELDNDGEEPFPEIQIDALLRLLADIQSRHGMPPQNVLGHADVAPRRKTDPSHRFPWKTLADKGFGLWCDVPWPVPPESSDAAVALQALGYDVSDPVAAQRAFRRHFAPDADAPEFTERERGLLRCLLARKNGFGASTPGTERPTDGKEPRPRRDNTK